MTGEARFCPKCGTRRAGFFRFCPECGFDFDELLPPESRREAEPKAPAPTRSAVARPADLATAEKRTALTAAVPGSPAPSPAARAARRQIQAAAAPPAAPLPRVELPKPPVWPPPGAIPAEDLERGAPTASSGPAGVGSSQVGRVALPAPGVPAASARVEPARPSTVRRRPDLTLTRLAIVVLAALLAFSAVSNFVRSGSTAVRSPAATTALGSPVVGGSAPPDGPSVAPSIATDPTFRPAGETQHATVSSIVDGDTITVDIDGAEFPLRYIGMDAPETLTTNPDIKRIADAATAANASMVEGQDVYLEREVSDKDRFGRLLRDVWLVDSGGSYVLINVELVRLGYAQLSTFPPDVRYLDELTEAEQMAKDDGVGLWGLASPPAPAGESPAAAPQATPQNLVGGGGAETCHASYDPCLPIVSDLDCADVRAMGAAPVTVNGPDEYMLDAEEDGLGCESDE